MPNNHLDLIGWFAATVSGLMNTRAGFLMPFAKRELYLLTSIVVIIYLIKSSVKGRFDKEEGASMTGRIIAAFILLSCYATPVGSTGLSLVTLPLTIGQALSSYISNGMADPLLDELAKFSSNIQKPGFLDTIDIFVYLATLFEMSLINGALFLINAGAMFGYGVTALFGPIRIPMLVTKHFQNKFFGLIDGLFKYAMLLPVCSSFTFIWSSFFMLVFSKIIHGDYTLPHLLGLTATIFAMVFSAVFMALKLPAFAEEQFGHGSSSFHSVGADMAAFASSFIGRRV